MHKRIKQGLIHSLTLENQIYRTLFPPKVDFFFSASSWTRIRDLNVESRRARPSTSVCQVSSTTQQNASSHPGFDLL